MLSPFVTCVDVFFAAALLVALVHASKVKRREATAVLVQDLVLPNDAGVVGTDEQERLACVRRTVLGVLYADDAGIVSEVG